MTVATPVSEGCARATADNGVAAMVRPATFSDQADAHNTRSSTPHSASFHRSTDMRRPALALSHGLHALYCGASDATMAAIRQDRARQPNGQFRNCGYANTDGYYEALQGEWIEERYFLEAQLGQGSFGVVIRAYDVKHHQRVAIKIARCDEYFSRQGMKEAMLMDSIRRSPGLQSLTAQLLRSFTWKGHHCIVYRLESITLYQAIRHLRSRGCHFSLNAVRQVALQLVTVVDELAHSGAQGIVHSDIKTDNILMRTNPMSSSSCPNDWTQVVMADFGSANATHGDLVKYMQSRSYRSPEVLLRHPFSLASDVWSVGCVLLEMWLQTTVFASRSETELLTVWHDVLGEVPRHMISTSRKSSVYYDVVVTPPSSSSLSGEESEDDEDALPQYKLKGYDPKKLKSRSIQKLVHQTAAPRLSAGEDIGKTEIDLFCDFVSRMLTYDPTRRITSAEALQHPFLAPALVALEKQFGHEGFRSMPAPTPDDRHAVRRSLLASPQPKPLSSTPPPPLAPLLSLLVVPEPAAAAAAAAVVEAPHELSIRPDRRAGDSNDPADVSVSSSSSQPSHGNSDSSLNSVESCASSHNAVNSQQRVSDSIHHHQQNNGSGDDDDEDEANDENSAGGIFILAMAHAFFGWLAMIQSLQPSGISKAVLSIE